MQEKPRSFREVQLLVNGQIAGIAFPYPVTFTGDINPACWRPIAAYGALDLPTYFLDLTRFVPLLTDEKPHLFTIVVVSVEVDKTILQNSFVSGLLQVITDQSSKPTTGRITSYSAEAFAQTRTTGSVGENGDISITAYLDNFLVQNYFQSSPGSVLSTHNSVPAVTDLFSYPITINVTSNDAGTFLSTPIDHSYDRTLRASLFILGSTIKECQVAGGFCTVDPIPNIGRGNGTNNNTFSYINGAGNTFNRRVDATFNNITWDEQSGSLSSGPKKHGSAAATAGNLAGGRFPFSSSFIMAIDSFQHIWSYSPDGTLLIYFCDHNY
ncbi:Peptide-N4-(N-acetyl-beta-glucosaminyl)asparagine amidase A [Mycena venus]|uniref:Peptide-N4-(N-acetyl-beta-glucosaminyl)asparagine amidase A n=1 Tax=Mycena venus TaxID=2733690 RepID=A0A8H7CZ04_9AGAR|nr:Peptide-N4-(N-acetyl-beta-glucosaminyl)asparagine amidase A [Mycena venus]